jgi:hypothetical protein
MAVRICPQCEKPLPKDAHHKRIRHEGECAAASKRERERSGDHSTRECRICHDIFRPYNRTHTVCGSRECRTQANNERRGTAPAQQSDRLFRHWDQREDLDINDLREGTRLLAISDTQFPFVDEPLLRAVNRLIEEWQPNEIVYNGDIVDFYAISSFDDNPHRQFTLRDEVEQAADMLREHRRVAPNARQWFLEGNHEQRLDRYLTRKASELADIVPSLVEMLQFDEHDIQSVPYGKSISFLGFCFTHGNFVSAFSAYTARRHYERYHSSGANGHTHRLGSYSHTDMHGRSHTWLEMGCLCRRDMEYVKGVANWQQGFITARVHNGALVPTLVHVIEMPDHRFFMVEGKAYPIFD